MIKEFNDVEVIPVNNFKEVIEYAIQKEKSCKIRRFHSPYKDS